MIEEKKIYDLLKNSKRSSKEEVDAILNKARTKKGLDINEVATLLQIEDESTIQKMLKVAGEIKNEIYGKRVVIFAPIYISDFCVNNCRYCGYKRDNKFERRKLTMSEIKDEVKILQKDGHKRLALEVGEHPTENTIEYILEAIKTIYETQDCIDEIRRININIAATTVENYKKLKEANIGTYILFQETYHKKTYEKMHPNSIKGDYMYHLTAFDRAIQSGIDDVGGGVLFGLADYKFEVLGLILHNMHLEKTYGVGFHTVSVPRLQEAEGISISEFTNLIDDKTFEKIVAILRMAIPFTGMILSTRENEDMRRKLLNSGITQISAGSCTGVGGYSKDEEKIMQFNLSDERSTKEVITTLLNDGHIPSYCTACYRTGRTGDRFMQLAKSGEIQNVCAPNALLTLAEYVNEYGDEKLKVLSNKMIENELHKIESAEIKELVIKQLDKTKKGERDLYL